MHPIVFGKNSSNWTTNIGGNITQISFSAFIQPVWVFKRKKLKNSIQYPISHRKGYTHFCHPTPRFPQKWLYTPKIIFRNNLKKIFFSKKLLNKEYSKPHFPPKRLYWFLLPDASFPSKQSCPPTNCLSQFFLKIQLFSKNLLNNKISGT